MEVLHDRPGDGDAVVGAGAAPDLVQDRAGCAAWRGCRMLAVSTISTMKVDCPAAISSCAPMRVKMRSTRPMRAASAGTNEPICAISTISAAWRR